MSGERTATSTQPAAFLVLSSERTTAAAFASRMGSAKGLPSDLLGGRPFRLHLRPVIRQSLERLLMVGAGSCLCPLAVLVEVHAAVQQQLAHLYGVVLDTGVVCVL